MTGNYPDIDDLAELLEYRTGGAWFVRIDRNHYGNEDLYIDTDERDRHWPHIGTAGICHVEGKNYEHMIADVKLMAAAPALARRVIQLEAQLEAAAGRHARASETFDEVVAAEALRSERRRTDQRFDPQVQLFVARLDSDAT